MRYEEAIMKANECERTAMEAIDARMGTLIASLPENGHPDKNECVGKWRDYLNANSLDDKKQAIEELGYIFYIWVEYVNSRSFPEEFKYKFIFGLKPDNQDDIDRMTKIYNEIDDLAYDFVYAKSNVYQFSDSKTVHIDGAVVITDPCYIAKQADIALLERYGDLSPLGIPTSAMRDTIYGDWGCSICNSDTGEPLGLFCADWGEVCVADKEEVEAYNPDFFEQYGDWCYTVIEDFKGEVVIKVFGTGNDAYVNVIGTGIRKSSGEVFNFESHQTSF